MTPERASRLDREVDADYDHVLGPDDAVVTLVEYGSYVCSYCHTAHNVIRNLRERFGDRMRYVYRHLPLTDRHDATLAAEIAEYASATGKSFWEFHDRLMTGSPVFREGEVEAIAAEYGIPPREQWDPAIAARAVDRVRDNARAGLRGGARVTPTFFINGRRYEGPWDEASLSEALFRSLGHRLHAASVDFARWAPSTGLLLLLMTVIAVVVSNTPFGPAFLAFLHEPAGVSLGAWEFAIPVVDWVNHGLLTIFFLVVGLEMKREFTIGRLATRRAAAFPIAAALGGMAMPALIYLMMAPPGFGHGWGITIATDTAFAVALIVFLGHRVPVELRVFLTAAVIVDDLVAILVVALFYTDAISMSWLITSALLTAGLVALNRTQIYGALPYAVLGILLWFALHEAGLHATLAGVILAIVTPTRPPANMKALLAQAQAVFRAEAARTRLGNEPASTATLRTLDAIQDRMESPASKLLHAAEPWSSYFVLPLFALANAGVIWSSDVLGGHGRLIAAIAIALVIGKPVGIFAGARLAAGLGIAAKPATYTWRQVAGAGGLAGIGFTMSLFIAGQAFTGADYDAAKIAIFAASIIAGVAGTLMLWTAHGGENDTDNPLGEAGAPETGSPIEPD